MGFEISLEKSMTARACKTSLVIFFLPIHFVSHCDLASTYLEKWLCHCTYQLSPLISIITKHSFYYRTLLPLLLETSVPHSLHSSLKLWRIVISRPCLNNNSNPCCSRTLPLPYQAVSLFLLYLKWGKLLGYLNMQNVEKGYYFTSKVSS